MKLGLQKVDEMAHPLHKTIGDVVKDSEFPNCQLARDPACGGKQNIPLFCSNKKSNETEYCNVDLLVLNNEIRVIVEIEEADVKPTQICGKFLTSALSTHFIHDNYGNIGMAESVSFIQVLDPSKLRIDKTSKIDQWKRLEKSISDVLPITGSKIKKYKLIYGSSSDFEKTKGNELNNYIKESLR